MTSTQTVLISLLYVYVFSFFCFYSKFFSKKEFLFFSLVTLLLLLWVWSQPGKSLHYGLFFAFLLIEWLLFKRKTASYIFPIVMILLQHFSLTLFWLVFYTGPLEAAVLPLAWYATQFPANVWFLLLGLLQAYLTARLIKKLEKIFGILKILLIENKPNKSLALGITLLTSAGITLQLTFTDTQTTVSPTAVASVFILLSIFAILAYLYAIRLQARLNYTKLLECTIEQQEMIYSEICAFQHDFKNIQLVLATYIQQGKKDEALEFLASLQDYGENTFLQINQVEVVAHIQLFSLRVLLETFMQRCHLKKITLTIQQTVAIHSLPMTEIDLIRVLSILLDNAYEAVHEQEKTKRQIWLSFTIERGTLVFSIKNPIDRPIIIEQLLKKRYTSKQNHSGLGLANLSKIIHEYDTIRYDFKLTDHMFDAKIYWQSFD